MLRRIYDNRQKANNSQTDGMCTSALDCGLVCELWRSCVGQRGCNLISYITRVPAIWRNAYNSNTRISSQLFLMKLCLSFLYLSFPAFHPTPVTLTFLAAFYLCYVCLVLGPKDPKVPRITSFPVLNFPCVQSGMWAKNSSRKFLSMSVEYLLKWSPQESFFLIIFFLV